MIESLTKRVDAVVAEARTLAEQKLELVSRIYSSVHRVDF